MTGKFFCSLLLSALISAAAAAQTHEGHEYVDLGLSVNWATCNLGAGYPEDSGDYFAWGETFTKLRYEEDTYTYSDNDTYLPLERDAAHLRWGGDWRMPSIDEIHELKDKCTWVWTDENGMSGCKVTGPNGRSIFLPAAGSTNDCHIDGFGVDGDYLSSMCFYEACYILYFEDSTPQVVKGWRHFGSCIRPVFCAVNAEEGLIYEGAYTFSGVSRMNGQVSSTVNGYPVYLKLYDDHLHIDFSESRSAECERIYDGSGSYVYKTETSAKYVFDNDFNLTFVDEFVMSYLGMSMKFVNEQFYVKGELPPPDLNRNVQTGYGGYGSGNYNQGTGNTQSRRRCTYCDGTGEIVKNDATTYGLTDPVYCDKCRKMVSRSHYHTTCPSCHGKGWY